MSKTKKCVGKEGFQRMNYLCQLSNEASVNGNKIASINYSQLMMNVAKRTVQRLEPEIKQMVCKCCNSLLIAGVSCKVRLKNKRVCWTCNTCQTRKVFKATRDYSIWLNREEAIVEVLDYAPT